MDESQGPGIRDLLFQMVIAVLGTGLVVWSEMPPWQRSLVTARCREQARRALAVLARRSGHRAMSDELDGRYREADTGYGFTYRLSRLRDRL
jgi:hypothetical protein